MYDEETSLYYLQSRYYDPEVGRFISADVLLSTGQGVMGHDAYAYCLGNPVMMVDEGGALAKDVELANEEGGGGPAPLKYRYYSSPNEAARAWAREWRNKDSEYEYGAIIFESIVDGQKRYRIGNTRRGEKTRSKNRRANVISPLYLGLFLDIDNYETPYGLLHTHPLQLNGDPSKKMSDEDINCTKGIYPFVNLECIYMVPYGGGTDLYKYTKGGSEVYNIHE